MKTISEIIKQEPVFLNDWSDQESVFKDFEIEVLENVKILFASYSYEIYEGSAWVLFEQDGNLYEVNGGHCSCYGLEEQWEPEEVLLKELENRLLNGTFGESYWAGNNFKKVLCEFLGIEFKLNEV